MTEAPAGARGAGAGKAGALPPLPRAFAVTVPSGERDAVTDPYNRRLKLYGLRAADYSALDLAALFTRAEGAPGELSKITVYAPPGDDGDWHQLGFRREGTIRGFFAGGGDAALWAAYRDPVRAVAPREPAHAEIVSLAQGKKPVEPRLPEGYSSHGAVPGDAAGIAELMASVFSDYPTPLTPAHLARLIETRANRFRFVRSPDGRMAAVASGEIDHPRRTAEMTDCATRPEERGRGLMVRLLREIERDLASEFAITDLYTLARADEVGMNCAFAKLGYDFTGRLINNCRMPNGWESVNVWCRTASGG